MEHRENDIECRKILLINYLDKWCSRKKVKCKTIFQLYKTRIQRDQGLTENMLEHISKFMRYKMKTNEETVYQYFSPLLIHPPNDQEDFSMRYSNDVGFHFKLPQTLKDDFDQIARVDRIPVMSILNQLVTDFRGR